MYLFTLYCIVATMCVEVPSIIIVLVCTKRNSDSVSDSFI